MQIIRIPENKNYTVEGLNEDTAYTFTAYASTQIGAGPSAALTTRTDENCRLLSLLQLSLIPRSCLAPVFNNLQFKNGTGKTA